MNFKILKEIIVSLKEKIKCESCGKRFSNKEINILEAEDKRVTIGCACTRCQMQTIIDVSLMKAEDIDVRDHKGLQVRATTLNTVSQDDVLDVKNFLKNFSGNFKEIFKK